MIRPATTFTEVPSTSPLWKHTAAQNRNTAKRLSLPCQVATQGPRQRLVPSLDGGESRCCGGGAGTAGGGGGGGAAAWQRTEALRSGCLRSGWQTAQGRRGRGTLHQ